MNVEIPAGFLEFIRTHGDVYRENEELQYLHLPQWFVVNTKTGIVEGRMPDQLAGPELKSTVFHMIKSRYKRIIGHGK